MLQPFKLGVQLADRGHRGIRIMVIRLLMGGGDPLDLVVLALCVCITQPFQI